MTMETNAAQEDLSTRTDIHAKSEDIAKEILDVGDLVERAHKEWSSDDTAIARSFDDLAATLGLSPEAKPMVRAELVTFMTELFREKVGPMLQLAFSAGVDVERSRMVLWLGKLSTRAKDAGSKVRAETFAGMADELARSVTTPDGRTIAEIAASAKEEEG